jgi:hypothetical protein
VKFWVKLSRKPVGAGSPECFPPTNNLNKLEKITKNQDVVGAGSPECFPPTNNLNKPAPPQGLNEIN